jgi:valyl-tRNA synthetase
VAFLHYGYLARKSHLQLQLMFLISTYYYICRDHAGIATQLVVEKQLATEGISRLQLGREEFVKRIWQWKEEKGNYIIDQMKQMGASADWSREKFTLDSDMNEAVNEAFIRLYKMGLIYKGQYMVNWSPALQTAVSDLEVDYSEEEGILYYFKYPLVPLSNNNNTSGGANPLSLDNNESLPENIEYIPVATTRPETILGDTALCVHPEDERYKHFIGRKVRVPMVGREIPGMLLLLYDNNYYLTLIIMLFVIILSYFKLLI